MRILKIVDFVKSIKVWTEISMNVMCHIYLIKIFIT